MYIDNDEFGGWMQKLYAKLEELCKDVRVLRNADRVLPEDDNLLDNQDLCLLFKVSIKPCNATGLSVRCILHYQRKSVLQGFRCPGVHQGKVQRHHATPVRERTLYEEKEVNLKSRNGECASSIPAFPVYGLPSLSASFFSCSACSFNSLARSSASACFWMRYSKSITESVRLRIKPLSRCHLNLFSSISKVSPSACPCISK